MSSQTDLKLIVQPPPVIKATLVVGQGPAGKPAPIISVGSIERTAAANLSGHRIIMIDEQGNATYASNDDSTHATRIVGMTTHAAIAGAPVAILTYGEITEPGWNWNVDQPVYLGIDGLITQIPPEAPDAKFLVVVGFPISATALYINLGASITLTA